ncbi:hypothetical protein [Actinoplanes flavus]|uniref:Uncharacterized protein n=1 Tax=Actinoplanes flavus TaxID=2820290 RepID=A0ABS3UUH5_9ACTN|nr:hypothetical protein [Actinoplanes flavus]MBO3742207.1 hypothetical protein [Actinoplanes flavus]
MDIAHLGPRLAPLAPALDGIHQYNDALRRIRTEPRGPGTPQVLLVDNRRDHASNVARLAELHQPAHGRIVVRPTPGGSSRPIMGLDLLTALGINPELLRKKGGQLNSQSWRLAQAWMHGHGVTELLVDRAHDLPAEIVADLAGLAAAAGARLWLVWSADTSAEKVLTALADTDRSVALLYLPDFHELLEPVTAPYRRQRAPGPGDDTAPLPALPAADFTTFRAACHRLLSRRDFARVDGLYCHTADTVDQWIRHRLPDSGPPALDDIAGPLAAWLRDVHLGPHPAPLALLRLRATQAALFGHGLLLRWNPARLGPDPAGRLPGTLTEQTVTNLTALPRTDHAAVTALSLHLNKGAAYLNCWQIGDLSDDADMLHPRPSHVHRHPVYASEPVYQDELADVGVDEQPCTQPVILPPYTRPILAAHRAYRLAEGATPADDLFWYLTASRTRPDSAILREAVILSCRRLNLDPPWMHRSPCRNGADTGLRPRIHGWLAERGLTLHELDRDLAQQITDRHTRWIRPAAHQ